MKNETIIAAGAALAALLILRPFGGGGSLFGSGGDSGQPTGTILYGTQPGQTTSSPAAPTPVFNIYMPAQQNYTPQPFQISDKILAAMRAAAAPQPKTAAGTVWSAAAENKAVASAQFGNYGVYVSQPSQNPTGSAQGIGLLPFGSGMDYQAPAKISLPATPQSTVNNFTDKWTAMIYQAAKIKPSSSYTNPNPTRSTGRSGGYGISNTYNPNTRVGIVPFR